jgi:hypothetical protein
MEKKGEEHGPPYSNTFGSYPTPPQKTQGECHIVSLPFTTKSILLRQKKKTYGNSNISPCKNIPKLQKIL